jgi:hypothetical protein
MDTDEAPPMHHDEMVDLNVCVYLRRHEATRHLRSDNDRAEELPPRRDAIRTAGRRPPGIARRAAVVLMAAAMLPGCSASNTDEAAIPLLASNGTTRVRSRDDVELEIRSTAPIRVGKNTLNVRFPERSADLTAASAFMAAHGHGSPPPAIERDGDTFVVRDLVLFMAGRWELRLELRAAPGQKDEAVVAMDVP